MVNMSASRESSQATHQPEKNDVLLGRAANVFHHPGNRRYRHIIAMNLRRYKEAKTRLDKMVLIRQVTEQVLDGGRVKFLRRDGKLGTWSQVPFRTAQDKVSHALRDGINKPIFTPLMAEEEPLHIQGPPPVQNDRRNPSDMPAASMPLASQMDDPRGRFGAPPNQQGQQRRPFFPSVRLDNMAAASASTRAALDTIGRLPNSPEQIPMPAPHQHSGRSAPSAHLLQQHQQQQQRHHAYMHDVRGAASAMDNRRLSAANQHPSSLCLPPPHQLAAAAAHRYVSPSIGMSHHTSLQQMASPNLLAPPAHRQHPQKSMGLNPYTEFLLKEHSNRLAETALRRQFMAEVQASHTKSLVDDVLQQYRANPNPVARAFLNQQARALVAGQAPANDNRNRPGQNPGDGSVSTNDTIT